MGAILFSLRLMLALAMLVLPFRPLRAAALAAGGFASLTALGPQGAGVPAVTVETRSLAGEAQAAVASGDFALAAALVAVLPDAEARLARPALMATALAQVRPLPASDAVGNHAGYAFLAALDPATPLWGQRAALYATRLP